jgi:subtilase family serine protease
MKKYTKSLIIISLISKLVVGLVWAFNPVTLLEPVFMPYLAHAAAKEPSIAAYTATPPLHIFTSSTKTPVGLTPAQIKAAYNLPATGGSGTVAIITGYASNTLANDLAVFSKTFNIGPCAPSNGCLEIHSIRVPKSRPNGWQMETSLDTEWAHAIAPQANILVVEADGTSATSLLAAIDYARSRKDVVAISMSWGGPEFPEETKLDSHFADASRVFFASSGDNGAGVSWPAVSPNVVAVGGSSLVMAGSNVLSEKAWPGSGGGVSLYEKEPDYQVAYSIPRASGMRAIPDVAYNADPSLGFAIYKTNGKIGTWYMVGGTSAGAPQWAAIQALGHSVTNTALYADKNSAATAAYFRDITSGSNGPCAYYCAARRHYDYVTGLGTPLTVRF